MLALFSTIEKLLHFLYELPPNHVLTCHLAGQRFIGCQRLISIISILLPFRAARAARPLQMMLGAF